MNRITWTIFIVAVLGLLGGLIVVSKNSKLDVSSVNTATVQKASKQDGQIADHVYGNSNSSVTLIEYGDFQCSGCGAFHPTIKAIAEEYKTQIRYIFRNFPLTSAHPNAKAAASAVEAAGLQGKYWEMHNLVYESQSDWNELTGQDRTDKFISYAKELSLNTDQFEKDMASESVTSKIAFDYALGLKDSVSETPSFYLNGKKIDSNTWGDEAKFKAALDAAIKKAEN